MYKYLKDLKKKKYEFLDISCDEKSYKDAARVAFLVECEGLDINKAKEIVYGKKA